MDPCVPRWCEILRLLSTRAVAYRIKVENPLAVHRGVIALELDGALQSVDEILLADDGQTHNVRVVLGEKPVAVAEVPEALNEVKGRAGSNQ